MNDKTFKYVTGRFRDFYRKNSIDLPPEIESREWGFIPFSEDGSTRMVRHKSMLEIGDPSMWLEQEHPKHVYASASKYEEPGAPTMDEKVWKSSDLVFDIDIDEDHLPESIDSADELTYSSMLDLAKEHALRLLEFLERDFGFTDIEIVFSGGRGYHIHVRDDNVQKLKSQDRTEIVSYIRGVNLDLDSVSNDDWAPLGYSLVSDKSAFSISGGWSYLSHKRLIEFMDEMLQMEKPLAIEKIGNIKNIGEKKAPMIYSAFEDNYNQIVAGEINVKPGMKALARSLTEETRRENYSEIDEPVTTDINRLIRMPGTLHGGHGLEVCRIEKGELSDFDPLVDAVPETFQGHSIKIDVNEPETVSLLNEEHEFEAGVYEVSEALGIHMMTEGLAEKD